MVESPSVQQRRRILALLSVIAAYALSFFQRFAPAGIASDLAALCIAGSPSQIEPISQADR